MNSIRGNYRILTTSSKNQTICFYLFSGLSTDQVLTIHGRRLNQVLQLFDGYPLRESFDNKFQIDASDLSHEFIVELLGTDSIRQITIGDKTIVDYYHDLYL